MQRYFIFLAFAVILTSCITRKKVVYFHNFDKAQLTDTLNNNSNTISSGYKVKTGDILYIKINGIEGKTSSYFNIDGDGKYASYNEAYVYLNSYTVNDKGEISIPVLGSIIVKEKTPDEIRINVETLLKQQLTTSSVIVKLISFQISVLGEVNKPGTFTIYDDKITIAKALSLAGDLTEFGNRKKIKIVRENNGINEIHYIDLTQQSTVNSPLFYLRPGDIVYSQPMNIKLLSTNLAPIRTILLGGSLLILILRLYKYL